MKKRSYAIEEEVYEKLQYVAKKKKIRVSQLIVGIIKEQLIKAGHDL